MIELQPVTHYIQKHIIGVLIYQKLARFRDLRPPRTDTNLFSYHLKLLIKQGIIDKTEAGYTLSRTGLAYADHVSTKKLNVRSQPKIVTMVIVKNKNGDILLHKRLKQPFIDMWTLPHGKIHTEDINIKTAATREVEEEVGIRLNHIEHVGDCYIRVHYNKTLLTSTLAHIFISKYTDNPTLGEWAWASRNNMASSYLLAPAVKAILDLTASSQSHFFVEFDEDWYA